MRKLLILLLPAVLVAVVLAVAAKESTPPSSNSQEASVANAMTDHRQIEFNTIDGAKTNLAAFSGKVVLAVNVASKCGYTPQYTGLEQLYKKYKDQGLVVVGFPANNFGGQEPGTNEEIKKFCVTNFNVTFPMMAKVSVKGDDIHPLFGYLTKESSLPGEIQWNFSKFLLDQNGKLIARWPSKVEPTSIEITSKIEEMLKITKAKS